MSTVSDDPAAPSLNAYCLWLVPSLEDQSDHLQSLINRLASLENLSPSFEPHITLLSSIDISTPLSEVRSKVRQAIQAASSKNSLRNLAVDLAPAQKGEKYYQSVLAPVKPSAALLALREECERAFCLKGTGLPEYFPHISLLYGELSSERREEIAGIANKVVELGSVEVDEVAIVRCVGTAESWQVVGTERIGS
ncbi:hypothetical protein IAU60_001134 [Kwoniella sp. DSM 27419]